LHLQIANLVKWMAWRRDIRVFALLVGLLLGCAATMKLDLGVRFLAFDDEGIAVETEGRSGYLWTETSDAIVHRNEYSEEILGSRAELRTFIDEQAPTERCRERMLRLMEILFGGGGTPSPVLIGGIGDSGTRSVVGLLRGLGVEFVFTSGTKDSKAWMTTFELRSCLDDTRMTNITAAIVYETLISTQRNLGFSYGNLKSHIEKEMWWFGMEFVFRALVLQRRKLPSKNVTWGIKQPRLTLLLPILKRIYGKDLQYVHVTRDIRDLAGGSHHIFYRQVCPYMFDGKLCSGGLRNRLDFNARYTDEILEWLVLHLPDTNFLVVRIEDFVDSQHNTDCILQLTHFIESFTPWRPRLRDLDSLKTSLEDHAKSYFGTKFRDDQRKELNMWSLKIPAVNRVLLNLDYKTPMEEDLAATWKPERFCSFQKRH